MDEKRVNQFGWIPDLPDHREHLFAARPEVLRTLPPRFDLTSACRTPVVQ